MCGINYAANYTLAIARCVVEIESCRGACVGFATDDGHDYKLFTINDG
jgi:hypothetical protein